MKTAKNLSGGSSYPENKNCKQILAGAISVSLKLQTDPASTLSSDLAGSFSNAQTAHSVPAYKFDDLT